MSFFELVILHESLTGFIYLFAALSIRATTVLVVVTPTGTFWTGRDGTRKHFDGMVRPTIYYVCVLSKIKTATGT